MYKADLYTRKQDLARTYRSYRLKQKLKQSHTHAPSVGVECKKMDKHTRTRINKRTHLSLGVECEKSDEDGDLEEEVDEDGQGSVHRKDLHGRHVRDGAQEKSHCLGAT